MSHDAKKCTLRARPSLAAATLAVCPRASCRSRRLRRHSPYSRRAGYTLSEMLVSVALAAIMMSMVFMAFTQASSIFSRSQALSEVYGNARAIFDLMDRDMSAMVFERSSSRVFWPDPGQMPNAQLALFDLQDFNLASGDGIDNDGDGNVDEEGYDKLNNDPGKDGLIDEDVLYCADRIAFLATTGVDPVPVSAAPGVPKQKAAWIEVGYRLYIPPNNAGGDGLDNDGDGTVDEEDEVRLQLQRYSDTTPGGALFPQGESGGLAGWDDSWKTITDRVISLSFLYWDGVSWQISGGPWTPSTLPPPSSMPQAIEIRVVLTDEQQRVTKAFTHVVWLPIQRGR